MIHNPKETVIVRFGKMELSAPADVLMLNYLQNVADNTVKAVSLAALQSIGEAFEGGIYAGIARGQNGEPDYHLILLEGDVEMDWNAAMAWAKEQGGDLPNRREQPLLFANLPELFEQRVYWSNTQHAGNDSSAWFQIFLNGYQSNYDKSSSLRARAVRRLKIQ